MSPNPGREPAGRRVETIKEVLSGIGPDNESERVPLKVILDIAENASDPENFKARVEELEMLRAPAGLGETEKGAVNDQRPQSEIVEPNAELNAHAKRVLGDELYAAVGRIKHPDYVGVWLKTPNKSFGGRTPEQLVASGGREVIVQALERLLSGDFS